MESSLMWLYKLNHTLGPVIGLYWRLRLKGERDRIPPDGPLLLAANHSSFLDPWFIGMAFPRLIRYLITDEWYYRSRAWKWIFSAFGTVPVRAGDPLATITAVAEVLRRGEVVGLFPEGGVSADGKMKRLRSGVARAACLSGAPVLPIGVRGAHGALPRHRLIPRPARVTIHVGRVIRFPGSPREATPVQSEIRAFNRELERAIRHLTGQEDGRSVATDDETTSFSGAQSDRGP